MPPSPLPTTYHPCSQRLKKKNQHRMATGSNATDISQLVRITKHLPEISRGQNFRCQMDIRTNQKSVEHRLGHLEL